MADSGWELISTTGFRGTWQYQRKFGTHVVANAWRPVSGMHRWSAGLMGKQFASGCAHNLPDAMCMAEEWVAAQDWPVGVNTVAKEEVQGV